MRNKMFKIISVIFVAVLLLFCTNLAVGDMLSNTKIEWLENVLHIAFIVSVVLLIISTVFAAILSVRECVKKEGRHYVDKFLLKVLCIFVLLFVFNYSDGDYLKGVVYPALIWIIVPRAYDYITSNE